MILITTTRSFGAIRRRNAFLEDLLFLEIEKGTIKAGFFVIKKSYVMVQQKRTRKQNAIEVLEKLFVNKPKILNVKIKETQIFFLCNFTWCSIQFFYFEGFSNRTHVDNSNKKVKDVEKDIALNELYLQIANLKIEFAYKLQSIKLHPGKQLPKDKLDYSQRYNQGNMRSQGLST